MLRRTAQQRRLFLSEHRLRRPQFSYQSSSAVGVGYPERNCCCCCYHRHYSQHGAQHGVHDEESKTTPMGTRSHKDHWRPLFHVYHCHHTLADGSALSLTSSSFSRFRTFSTNANRSDSDANKSTTDDSTKTSTASNVASSLRRMIKPFLLKCHPDIQQARNSSNHGDSDTTSISDEDTEWTKEINLRAIQNLNAYLDTVQTLLLESTSMSSIRRRRRPQTDDNNMFEIDFVISVESQSSSTRSGGKKRLQSRRNRGIEWKQSRRKVQLVLPKEDNDDKKKLSTAALERQVHGELSRLLRVAGLSAPHYLFQWPQDDDDDFDTYRPRSDDPDARGPFWHDVGGMSHAFTTSDPYKKNRERFVRAANASSSSDPNNNIWNEYNNRLYQRAMAQAEREDATAGLIAKDAKRRQELIARILARVQVQPQPSSPKRQDEDEEDPINATATVISTSRPGIVVDDSVLEQLMALRRLSLVLEDNFQVLQLEELGRLWSENLTLVLLPSWNDEYDNDDDINNKNDNDAPRRRRRMRRTKRRRRRSLPLPQQQDEWVMDDYAWTLHPDWSVAMHIPIDFEPDELVQELERNVQDYYRLLEEEQLASSFRYCG